MTLEEKVKNKIKREREYPGLTQEAILEFMRGLSLNTPTTTTDYTMFCGVDTMNKINEAIKDEVNRAKGSRKGRKRKKV